tara:strand:- start:23 stop:325 length:303 start_codon:yes stop_codon:yes gene_type:complete
MSKEIIDKINNNLIMLVEGFDDAERDYGYDLANEKHYVSELIDLVKNLSLSAVGNRRELLIAFAEDWNTKNDTDQVEVTEDDIDDYLAINCLQRFGYRIS